MPPKRRRTRGGKTSSITTNKNMDIQKYFNNLDKELNDGDVVVEVIDQSSAGESSTKNEIITKMDVVDDTNNQEEGQEVTYFVDEDGQFYFQPASESMTFHVIGENTEKILPDSIAEGNTDEELSYVYVMAEETAAEGEEGTEERNENENNMTVYDFEDEEQGETVEKLDESEDDKPNVTDLKVKTDVAKKSKSRKLYSCPHCEYSNSKKFLLSRHIKIHNDEKPHKCHICGRGFRSVVALNNHENTHTGSRPHKCQHCPSAFATTGELARHFRYRHSNDRPHKCTECDYAAVEYGKLKRHFRCHTGERPYQCPHCTYASPDTFKLKRHIRIHTGERPYECEICHASFSQSNSLKAHRLTHFPDKRPVFQCSLCPAKSSRKADLRGHIRLLHTSTNPIECKKCGKMLEDRYTYKIHLRTHIGEKSFKCNVCPYASVSRIHLSSHMLVHTDEKPFACATCDQKFRNKQLMKRHTNLYHNPFYVSPKSKPKNHECHECGNRFIHKGNLIRHLALHDPDSKVHEENEALKVGRKARIVEKREAMDDSAIYVEQGGDDDDSQFEVYEMIQVEENGEETVRIIDPTEEFQDKAALLKKQKMKKESRDNSKADMANCFGFDDEDDDGNQVILANENNEDDDSD